MEVKSKCTAGDQAALSPPHKSLNSTQLDYETTQLRPHTIFPVFLVSCSLVLYALSFCWSGSPPIDLQTSPHAHHACIAWLGRGLDQSFLHGRDGTNQKEKLSFAALFVRCTAYGEFPRTFRSILYQVLDGRRTSHPFPAQLVLKESSSECARVKHLMTLRQRRPVTSKHHTSRLGGAWSREALSPSAILSF